MRKERKKSISLLFMIVISCCTQVATVMKSSVVAGLFGASTELDAFNFANSIVSFVFGFVASGITTVIIPRYIEDEDSDEVNTFLTILYGLVFIIIVIMMIIRIRMVAAISNRDECFVSTASSILLVLFFVNILYSLTYVTAAHFQCRGYYNIPKIVNFFSQIVIVVVLLLVKELSIHQYTYIIASGLMINFLLDIIIAKKTGWCFRLRFSIRNTQVIKLFKLFIPIMLSTGIYRLSLMIDSAIASRLEVGKLTILSYSNTIAGMVNMLIIGNILVYSYPKIVRDVKAHLGQEKFWDTVMSLHAVVCLIIVGFFSVGEDGIALLFQHGQFNEEATHAVFIGCLIYLCGQQTNIIRDLIYRYFYACDDTKSSAKNSVIVSVVNITVSIMLVRVIGFYGIIIGTVIASFVSLVCIFIKFGREFGFEKLAGKIVSRIIKNIIITSVVVISIVFLKKHLHVSGQLLSILTWGIICVVLYVTLTLFFNKKVLTHLGEI